MTTLPDFRPFLKGVEPSCRRLFVTVSGNHLYGFPSADSDFDLRGAFVRPTKQLLGLTNHSETIEAMETGDNPNDVVLHEADESPADDFPRIAGSVVDALVVKGADRCSNIEDALADLLHDEPKSPERWSRYLAKTNADMLPPYTTLPQLSRELSTRLSRLKAALPGALERRAARIERSRSQRVRRSS